MTGLLDRVSRPTLRRSQWIFIVAGGLLALVAAVAVGLCSGVEDRSSSPSSPKRR